MLTESHSHESPWKRIFLSLLQWIVASSVPLLLEQHNSNPCLCLHSRLPSPLPKRALGTLDYQPTLLQHDLMLTRCTCNNLFWNKSTFWGTGSQTIDILWGWGHNSTRNTRETKPSMLPAWEVALLLISQTFIQRFFSECTMLASEHWKWIRPGRRNRNTCV